ncbi:hypothetical protein BD413DRAFT_191759 [Trametes elegans]|nr:hypothetical protein BD413DRAFT_191759 [Trametes elegans]
MHGRATYASTPVRATILANLRGSDPHRAVQSTHAGALVVQGLCGWRSPRPRGLAERWRGFGDCTRRTAHRARTGRCTLSFFDSLRGVLPRGPCAHTFSAQRSASESRRMSAERVRCWTPSKTCLPHAPHTFRSAWRLVRTEIARVERPANPKRTEAVLCS